MLISDPLPSPEAVRELAGHSHSLSVSHDDAVGSGLMELLYTGLTFDLTGWKTRPADHEILQGFSIDPTNAAACEALLLKAGPHLQGSEAMLPVVRGMMGALVELVKLEGVKGVRWLPACSAMSGEYFSRVISAWLDGGVFPGLGLVSLIDTANGSVRTVGMDFFGKQELEFDLENHPDRVEIARVAVRLIDQLITQPPLTAERTVADEQGKLLLLAPQQEPGIIRVLQ